MKCYLDNTQCTYVGIHYYYHYTHRPTVFTFDCYIYNNIPHYDCHLVLLTHNEWAHIWRIEYSQKDSESIFQSTFWISLVDTTLLSVVKSVKIIVNLIYRTNNSFNFKSVADSFSFFCYFCLILKNILLKRFWSEIKIFITWLAFKKFLCWFFCDIFSNF